MKLTKFNKKQIIICTAAIVLVVLAFYIKDTDKNDNKSGEVTSTGIAVAKDSDVVIQVKDITETVTFYPAEIDGTKLEVMAVKAPDGTIRTAFNTCQVCYSSGRGYYEQEGDKLICQNCGNSFGMEDVEVTRGGCNPVPITPEYKTVKDDTITIPKSFLAEATVIFGNWK